MPECTNQYCDRLGDIVEPEHEHFTNCGDCQYFFAGSYTSSKLRTFTVIKTNHGPVLKFACGHTVSV